MTEYAKSQTEASRFWRELFRQRAARVTSGYLLVIAVMAVVGAPLLRSAAERQDLAAARLSPTFTEGILATLGTNSLGQSVLARIVVGSQTTMLVAVGAVVLAVVIGTLMGSVAGYKSGTLDVLCMRLSDVILSFPSLLLAVVVLYLLGTGAINVVIVLGIARMPVFMRIARGAAQSERTAQHVDACRVMGISDWKILRTHILPAVVRPIITVAALNMGLVMLLATALTFLGVGIQPPAVSWGLMVADGKDYLDSAWWISFFPGLIILVTTMALNSLSNCIARAFDPRMHNAREVNTARLGRLTS